MPGVWLPTAFAPGASAADVAKFRAGQINADQLRATVGLPPMQVDSGGIKGALQNIGDVAGAASKGWGPALAVLGGINAVGALSSGAAEGTALGSGLTPGVEAGSTLGTGGGAGLSLGSGITPGAATETIGGGALGSGIAPGATGSFGALSNAALMSPEAANALNTSFSAPSNPVLGSGITPGAAGEGLHLPTYPTQAGMGGQGLTVPNNTPIGNPASFINDPSIIGPAAGTVGGSGFVPSGTPPALGNPNSFINQGTFNGTPSPTTVPPKSPFSTSDLMKLAQGLMGGPQSLGGGGMLGQPSGALQQAPANIFTPVGPGALHPFGG